MKKHRSITFMVWFTVLAITAIAAAVKSLPSPMTAEQLEAELRLAQEDDRIQNELSNALFAESHRRATVAKEVRP